MSRTIEIVEVGPRDGLQNDATLLDTPVKLDFIDRLIAAGVKRMEAASFVHPKLVPAMADSAGIMAVVPRDRGVSYIGLALNERGMRRAIESRCDEINYVLVASAGFGKANQNATPEETADLLDRIAILAHDAQIPLSATVSVAFGDPFDGEVDPAILGMLAARAAAAGVTEFCAGRYHRGGHALGCRARNPHCARRRARCAAAPAFSQHAQHGAGQYPCRRTVGRDHYRCLGRWYWRLPVCAQSNRKCGHGRRRLHAGTGRVQYRHRS